MNEFDIYNGVLNQYNGSNSIVELPNTIKSIKDFAFYGKNEIEKIIIPEGVAYIGNYAFHNCENLVDIVLPESLTYLGDGVFSGCKSLERITIPANVHTIGKTAFYKCSLLKEINLPDTITSIGHTAFSFCSSLVTIHLPISLKQLGDSAFEECENLSSITLPEKLTTLGKRVFFHCINLRRIEGSKDLKEVGEGAFQTHGLVSVINNSPLFMTSKMFDCNWNFDWNYSFKMKNGDNYKLIDSYIPDIDLTKWKPMARVVVLTNFLETYSRYEDPYKQRYINWINEQRSDVVEYIITEKRFQALNTALENSIVTSDDVEPFFELIKDREEKAKVLEYKNKENKKDTLSDLESELMDLF